jgi:hypothetical protein
MSAPKVKNLIILILVMVNLFLLALVLPSRYKAIQQEKEFNRQLSQLFDDSGIRLDPKSIAKDTPSAEQLLTANETARTAAVLALLGSDAAAEELYDALHFTSPLGTARLSGSSFSAVLSVSAGDPLSYTRQCLQRMGIGYRDLQTLSNGDGAVVYCAALTVDDIPVHDAYLTFHYENGALTRVEGQLFTLQDSLSTAGSRAGLSCRDALMKFLGSRLSTGWMGSSIEKTELCWLLSRSSSESSTLRPAWRICTDAGVYLVNGITGDVTLSG